MMNKVWFFFFHEMEYIEQLKKYDPDYPISTSLSLNKQNMLSSKKQVAIDMYSMIPYM